MKLRQVTRHQLVTKLVEGEEVEVREKVTDSVPRIPFNRDVAVRKAMFYIAALFTAVVIVWGAGAIGWMLAHLVPVWVAYPAAAAYDVAWVYFLIAEWANRYDEERADRFRKVGWVTLLGSAFAIIWHAHMIDIMVVGFIGAGLTLAVKGMWGAYMSTGRVKLSPEYQALLKKRQEEAFVREALALSDRDRHLKDDELHRLRTALAYERGESSITVEREPAEQPIMEAIIPEQDRDLLASTEAIKPLTSMIADREQPSIADLAREQIAITEDNKVAVAAIMAKLPDAKEGSVAAAVRRERKKIDGPYL